MPILKNPQNKQYDSRYQQTPFYNFCFKAHQ